MKNLLSEEISKLNKLINYDRSKTLIENHTSLINEQSSWVKTDEGKRTIKFLTDLGHDRFVLQNATSANNAFNLAAVSAIRVLTKKLVEVNYTQTDPFFRVAVLNKKPSGGVQKFSSFDSNLIDKLNKNIELSEKQYSVDTEKFTRTEISSNRTIGGTFILEDFYFDYGKIFNTVKDLNSSDNYLFPDGVYNFFTQFFGGDNVNTIKNKIEIQNVSNRPKLNSGDGWKQISYTNRVTNETQWGPIVESLHIILPATSFVLNVFGGPPGMVIGAGLETIDAALYQFYDEDPYMAGLSLIFALVPLGELAQIPGFKQVTKEGVQEGLEKLLWKQVRKETLTEEEELFLKSLAKNKRIQGEFYNAVINTSLRKLANKNPKGFLEVIYWLYGKGLINYSKYSTIVNLTLGTVAYDYWAYHYLGKCSSSFKFSDLLKLIPKTEGLSVKNLIRQIEVQPFTSTEETCEMVTQIQLAKEKQKLLNELKKNYQKMVVTILKTLIKNNLVMGTNLSNTFQFEVAMIQTILLQCGFSKQKITTSFKNDKVNFSNASSVEKVVLVSSTGKKIETIFNDGKDVFYSKSIKSKGVMIALIYVKGENKPITRKIFTNVSSDVYNVSSEKEKFNWGFYDEKTKKSVEEFQKYFNLEIDGVIGSDTLKKLLSVVSDQKCGVLVNHSGMELTPDKENLLNDEIIKKYQDSLKNITPPKFDPNNLTPEQEKKIDGTLNKYLMFGSQEDIDAVMGQIEGKLQ